MIVACVLVLKISGLVFKKLHPHLN